MPNPLIIVDSESKSKIFLDYFDNRAEIFLMKSPLIDVSHYDVIDESANKHRLEFSFSPLPNHVQAVETLSGNPEREIVIALDGDSPNEYLSWLVFGYLVQQNEGESSVKRLRTAGYSESSLAEAMKDAGGVDVDVASEFYIRTQFNSVFFRQLRRLIGSNLGPGGRPINYATLSTLFLVADRELEIRMFTPRKRWQVSVSLGSGGTQLEVKLEKATDISRDGCIRDLKVVNSLKEQVQGKPFVIGHVDRSEITIEPPQPYMLTELLHDSLAQHGLLPGRVLAIVKELCHGVSFNNRRSGLLSAYTFDQEECPKWQERLRKVVADSFGSESVGNTEIEFAKGMLVPIYPEVCSDDLQGVLEEESLKVYEMIRKRALASQMESVVGESLKLHVLAGGSDLSFVSHYNTVINKGFWGVYQSPDDTFVEHACPLVDPQEGQELHFIDIEPVPYSGIPAEYYTCDTLFTDLTDFSVFAEPLNINMIQALFDNDYLRVGDGGYIVGGPNTVKVVNILNRAFPKMKGINLSAYIEQTVTEVLSGRKSLDFALKQFEQTLMIQGKILVKAKISKKINLRKRVSSKIIKQEPVAQSQKEAQADQQGEEIAPSVEATPEEKIVEDIDAESTGDDSGVAVSEPSHDTPDDTDADLEDSHAEEVENDSLLEKEYPEIVAPLDNLENGSSVVPEPQQENTLDSIVAQENAEPEPVTAKDETTPVLEDDADMSDERTAFDSEEEGDVKTSIKKKCQVCSKPMLLKQDRFGKFWTCSGAPGCRHAEAYNPLDECAQDCPLCDKGKLVNKRTPAGKSFYVCLDPDCEFMAWAKPYNINCKVCDNPYLVEKKSARGGVNLSCPRAGCNYMQSLPGHDQGESKGQKEGKKTKKVFVRRVKRKSGGKTGARKVRVVRKRK